MTKAQPAYVLGHSDRELDRLTTQARMFEPFTRQLLLQAGICPGMRVLDVGCGSGDVSFLAAGLVGSNRASRRRGSCLRRRRQSNRPRPR